MPKIQTSIIEKPLPLLKGMAILIAVYTFVHGIILFNRGIYWDDWVWQDNRVAVKFIVQELAFFVTGQYSAMVLQLAEPYDVFFSKLSSFLFYLIAQLSIYYFLVKNKYFQPKNALLVSLLFGINPLNTTRFILCNVHYAFAYALFYFGIALNSTPQRKNLVVRLLTLFVFFWSFITNSIVFFYGFFLLHLIWKFTSGSLKERLLQLPKFVARNLDYFSLPIVFWTVKKLFMQNMGEYSGTYNIIDLKNITGLTSSEAYDYVFYYNLVEPLWSSLLLLKFEFAKKTLVFIVLFMSMLLAWRLIHRFGFVDSLKTWVIQRKADCVIVCFGLLLFLGGMFPYLIVGKVPGCNDWVSRHQLLLPLGFSLMIYGAVSAGASLVSARETFRVLCVAAVVATFGLKNLEWHKAFLVDWYKQRSFIVHIQEMQSVRDHTNFLMDDRVPNLDVFGKRYYREFEWTGLFKRAFGDQKRYASSTFNGFPIKMLDVPANLVEMYKLKYKLKDYDVESSKKGPELTIFLQNNPDRRPFTWRYIFKLIYLEHFNEPALNLAVKEIIGTKTEKPEF